MSIYKYQDKDAEQMRIMINALNEASEWSGLYNAERAFDEAASASLDAQVAAAISKFKGQELRSEEVVEIGARAYYDVVYKWYKNWAVPTLGEKRDALKIDRLRQERSDFYDRQNKQGDEEEENSQRIGLLVFLFVALCVGIGLITLLANMINNPEWARQVL